MEPIVTTAHGPVRGTQRDGIARFLGIPYAAPPVGPLRFQAPVPPTPWTEPLDVTAFGPTPPKPAYPAPLDTILAEVEVPGDGYLNLNVWTPDLAGGNPVMVFIHGGAFANGNSALPTYDGHAFARDGIVLVTLNYRLGVEGFALLDGAPANRGLRDQIAALEWVRDNIASFGGDPANVTIFGESAGAMSVVTLLTSPRAQSLFAKAIAQSGSVQAAATPADAALVTGILGEHLGLVPRVESLAELGSATIIKAQRAVAAELTSAPNPARFGQSVVAAQMAFIPVIDGDIVPVHPAVAIHAGMGSGIPLLIGVNSDEYRLFLVPTGVAGAMTDEALEAMAAAIGAPEGITETYRRARPDDTPGDHFAALLSDLFFWLPSFTVAQTRRAQGAVTFAYEFGYSTGPQLRACHAAELGYVFDTLTAAHFGGAEAAQGLADRMHGAWVEFARHGNPGWSDGDGTVMVFTDPHPHLDSDPMTLPRAAWATPMR